MICFLSICDVKAGGIQKLQISVWGCPQWTRNDITKWPCCLSGDRSAMWRRLESQSGFCLWLQSLTHYRTQSCTCSGGQQMVLHIGAPQRVAPVFVLLARLSQTRLISSITQAARTLLTYVVSADGADMSGPIIADDRLLWVQMSAYTQSVAKKLLRFV